MKRINPTETIVRDGLVYHQDTNESVTGVVKYFRENGQLNFRGNFVDGKQEGPFEIFHENGQLSLSGNLVDGKKDGSFKKFYENGGLESRSNHIDGELGSH